MLYRRRINAEGTGRVITGAMVPANTGVAEVVLRREVRHNERRSEIQMMGNTVNTDWRDTKGRFLPGNRIGFQSGNPGGPGRPQGSRSLSRSALLRLLVSCVHRDPEAISGEQVRELLDAAFKAAQEGDSKIIIFLLRAMFGDNWGVFMETGEAVYYSQRLQTAVLGTKY